MSPHVVFDPAVEYDGIAGCRRWNRFERIDVLFGDDYSHTRKFPPFLRVRLPDRAFVPTRFQVMNVFASEIALHGDEFAHVPIKVSAPRDDIINRHPAPGFFGIIVGNGRCENVAGDQSADEREQNSFHSRTTLYSNWRRLKRRETRGAARLDR